MCLEVCTFNGFGVPKHRFRGRNGLGERVSSDETVIQGFNLLSSVVCRAAGSTFIDVGRVQSLQSRVVYCSVNATWAGQPPAITDFRSSSRTLIRGV